MTKHQEMFELPDAKKVRRSKLFSSSLSSDDVVSVEDSSSPNLSKSALKSGRIVHTKSIPALERDVNGTETEAEPPVVDYGFEYEFIDTAQQQAHTTHVSNTSTSQTADSTDNHNQNAAHADRQEQSFEFNLFAPKPKAKAALKPTSPSTDPTATPKLNLSRSSPPAKSTSPPSQGPQKITIRADSPSPSPGTRDRPTQYTILHPRAPSYYFTSALPEPTQHQRRTQYADTAVSTGTVIRHSTTPWPGTHLPWRVISVSRSRLAGDTTRTGTRPDSVTVSERRAGRPSKKRRIQVRKRMAVRRAVVEQGQAAAEAEREKRTRRNREKKVKKKMREKAKKAEARLGESGEGDHVPGVDRGDSAVVMEEVSSE